MYAQRMRVQSLLLTCFTEHSAHRRDEWVAGTSGCSLIGCGTFRPPLLVKKSACDRWCWVVAFGAYRVYKRQVTCLQLLMTCSKCSCHSLNASFQAKVLKLKDTLVLDLDLDRSGLGITDVSTSELLHFKPAAVALQDTCVVSTRTALTTGD